MVEDKRPMFAIDVIRMLFNLLPSGPASKTHFIIAGDGPIIEAVKAHAASSIHHTDDIIVLGSIAEEQKLQLLSAADVFFMPTLMEGLSISVAEAMCMSLPVGSDTRVGGLPELVTYSTGFLVDLDPSNLNRDKNEFAEALCRFGSQTPSGHGRRSSSTREGHV